MPKHATEPSSRSVQDYLRALALLSSASAGGSTTTGDLASYLGVAPASVTEMLKKLAGDGLVRSSPYHGASLTQKGTGEALRVTRKHRLLERFLSDVLLIPLDKVHAQACAMEHSLSDEAEESLCRLLKHPDRCSDDGQVIPACDTSFDDCGRCMGRRSPGVPGTVEKRGGTLAPVSSLDPGATGRVSFIRGEGATLRKIRALGLLPGTTVKAGSRRLPNGTLLLSVGGNDVAIGSDVAAKVFVAAGAAGKP